MSERLKSPVDTAFPAGRSERSASFALPRACLPVLLAICDVFAIFLASALAMWLHEGSNASFNLRNLSASVPEVAVLLFLILGWARGFYGHWLDGWSGRRPSISDIAAVWTVVIGAITAIMFLLKAGASFSRAESVLFYCFGLLLLITFRALGDRLIGSGFRRGLIANRDVAVFMFARDDRIERLQSDGLSVGVRLRDVWLDEPHTVPPSEVGRGIVARMRRKGLNELLILAGSRDLERVRLLAEELRLAPLRVRLLVNPDLAWMAGAAGPRLGGNIAAELSRPPLTWAEQVAKRIFDLVLGAIALMALAPMLLLVAAAIRIESKGPVIFRQKRDGFGDLPFMIYKFRSMRVMEDGPEVVQATRDDARITRVGRFIRRTSIDELPQLLNVLRGDMSIIGPRPHAVAHGQHYSRMIAEYAHRHHVKPGLTGWAQVNGSRGETPTVDSMKRRVDLDIWYIANWSFWLDVKIICLTAIQVIFRRNAY